MTGEVYIHYGADAFNPSHGFPVVKPHGGLWASRKRASYGWAKWCEENSFRDCAAEPSFQFIMRNPEKVAVIHNLNDLRQLPMVRDVPPGMWEEIDFVECLRRGIDAVELCWYGEEYQDQRADDLYLALYGWDCDSIVVLNPDAVIQI